MLLLFYGYYTKMFFTKMPAYIYLEFTNVIVFAPIRDFKHKRFEPRTATGRQLLMLLAHSQLFE